MALQQEDLTDETGMESTTCANLQNSSSGSIRHPTIIAWAHDHVIINIDDSLRRRFHVEHGDGCICFLPVHAIGWMMYMLHTSMLRFRPVIIEYP